MLNIEARCWGTDKFSLDDHKSLPPTNTARKYDEPLLAGAESDALYCMRSRIEIDAVGAGQHNDGAQRRVLRVSVRGLQPVTVSQL